MLTVFTPTYNRQVTLPRLFESLKAQSDKSFEWLIIDDGSTDGTSDLCEQYTAESLFNIRYYKKANKGKHTAYNEALCLAKGEWFFCVDSDDCLSPDSIKIINEYTGKITLQTGIAAYKSDRSGKLLCSAFPKSVELAKFGDLETKYNCRGEYSYIFPTEIAKAYPFPEIEGEKFVTESVIYDRMSTLTMYLLPQSVTVCEYMTDGYSRNAYKTMIDNPGGYVIYHLQRIDSAITRKERFSHQIKYCAFKILSHNSEYSYKGKYRVSTAICYPLGAVGALYYLCRKK